MNIWDEGVEFDGEKREEKRYMRFLGKVLFNFGLLAGCITAGIAILGLISLLFVVPILLEFPLIAGIIWYMFITIFPIALMVTIMEGVV